MARRKRHRSRHPSGERPAAEPDDAVAADRWRPWLLGGVCALLVARPLFPSESAFRGDGLPVVMLWITLGVLWMLGAVGRRDLAIRFGWADAAVLLLVGLHTIAAIWATTRGSPRPAVNMLWEWVGLGLSFLLVRQFVAGRREARAVLVVMVGLAVALAGHGLYQWGYAFPKTRAAYFNDPDKTLRENEMWFEPGSRDRELFEMRLDSHEPTATFALTNSLAGYLAPWLVVAAGIAVTARRGVKPWRTWLAVAVCAVPITICLVLTKSRSAYGAAAVGLGLAWLVCRARGARIGWKLPVLVAGAAAGLGVAAVVLGGLDAKVLSELPKSLGYRVQYWQSTLAMIGDHPLAGCGPGNFQDTYTQYMLPEASEEIADPHNFVLEVWATAGTPAMLALAAVLGLFAVGVSRRRGARPCVESDPASPVPGGQPDATAWVFAGAACGFVLSVLVGQMSSAPPGIVPVLLGLPLAALAAVLLFRWVEVGELPIGVPAAGVVVLLVNLLAAGGIGFPGVSGTLWLLMGLGLNVADDFRFGMLPRSAALAGLVMMLALAFACSHSGLRPVLDCQAKLQLASRHPGPAAEYLEEAAAADPLAAEPWRQLGSLAFERWLAGEPPEADRYYGDFRRCMSRALDLAPNSANTWRMYGDRYWRAYTEKGKVDAIREAVLAYRRAVDLYPSNGPHRAKLALALRAAGDEAEFRQEAARALRLDELNPHADKKLDDEDRDELRAGLKRSIRQEN